MTPEQKCPALNMNAPHDQGITISSESHDITYRLTIKTQINFTQILGTPDPQAECALLKNIELSREKTVLDKTSACHRCARTVRAQRSYK